MKRYVSCPNCGYKLFKAEIGSAVEMTCPNCKQPMEVTVNPESVLTVNKTKDKAATVTASRA